MSPSRRTTFNVVGKPIDRVDGRLKVTGAARYSAEHAMPDLTYAVAIQSTIAKGRIDRVESGEAESSAGVLAVYTCANPPMTLSKKQLEAGHHLFLLQDDTIHFAGQIIGLVVADSFENATYAASLVKISYVQSPANTNFEERLNEAVAPSHEAATRRGSFAKGLSEAVAKIDETYTTPIETHNPMEPFATTAAWDGGNLTLYESTQGIFATQATVAKVLGIEPSMVRVLTPFVGGGFGSKLSVWPHAVLAAMAAQKLNRPVKVVLTRGQMSGPVGFRPQTTQHVTLGATREGKLTAIRHQGISSTSIYKEFLEQVAEGSRLLYQCPNVETQYRVVELDIGQPTWMRAPGHAPGSFALECAMDELAYKLNMDPIELRLANYAAKDQTSGLPWSSISLKECYRQGAERFRWNKRNHEPRSMRDGNLLVGMGMATALHSCWRNPASAKVRLLADGTALVQSGSQDIGTGTYTIMTQIAAEELALPLERVKFELGDTNLPTTPLSGGSTTAGSVGQAVSLASIKALEKLVATAIADRQSPLFGTPAERIVTDNGILYNNNDRSKRETYQAVIERTKSGVIETKIDAKLDDEESKYSMSTFGAQFAEVKIDPDLGTIRVSRFVGAYGAGRILNAKTARSQMLGGITFGIGMALMEKTVFDHNLGRIVNADLAEYHVPVHADIGELDPFFVKEEDLHINDIGVKGVGELGITGAAAAIANAVFHATGIRVRDLPITIDKLL